MTNPRAPRSVATAAAFTLLLLGTAACGGDDEPTSGGGGGSGSSAGVEPAGGGDEPASDLDVCGSVTVEEISTAMGTTGLTVEEVPGGGCNFADADDPRQPSVVLNQVPVDDANGGFEGLQAGVTATIAGESEDLTGVGDQAFVVTGTLGGGSAVNGAGAVRLGDVGVQVTLLQSGELTDGDVRQRVTDVLTLVASKA